MTDLVMGFLGWLCRFRLRGSSVLHGQEPCGSSHKNPLPQNHKKKNTIGFAAQFLAV